MEISGERNIDSRKWFSMSDSSMGSIGSRAPADDNGCKRSFILVGDRTIVDLWLVRVTAGARSGLLFDLGDALIFSLTWPEGIEPDWSDPPAKAVLGVEAADPDAAAAVAGLVMVRRRRDEQRRANSSASIQHLPAALLGARKICN